MAFKEMAVVTCLDPTAMKNCGDHCKKGLSVSSKSTQRAPKQDRLEKVAVSDKRPLTGLIRDRGRSDEGLGVTSHTGVARAKFC